MSKWAHLVGVVEVKNGEQFCNGDEGEKQHAAIW